MKKPLPVDPIDGVTWERDEDLMRFTLANPDETTTAVVVGIVNEQLDFYPNRSAGQKRLLSLLP